jgi:hypothetical protein
MLFRGFLSRPTFIFCAGLSNISAQARFNINLRFKLLKMALELRRLADFNTPPLSPPKYCRMVDQEEKDFVNRSVNRVYKKLFTKRQGMACVLDAEDWGTTRSIARQIGYGLRIALAQRCPKAYACMERHLIKMRNVKRLVKGDYADLNTLLQPGEVSLDHADFCSSWKKEKTSICDRLEMGIYAKLALIRITVCSRCNTDTDIDTVRTIIQDVKRAAKKGGYRVKALKVKDWVYHKDLKHDPTSVAYMYGKRTMNMLFIVAQA